MLKKKYTERQSERLDSALITSSLYFAYIAKSLNLVRFSNFINNVGSFRSENWLGI